MKIAWIENNGIRFWDIVKKFLFIFCLTIIIIVGVTAILYFASAKNELSMVENQELTNISTISKIVARSFDTTVADIVFLGELVSDYVSGKKTETEFLNTLSPFLRSKSYYNKLVICDTKGKIISEILIKNGEILKKYDTKANYKKNPDFINTLAEARGHVYVSDFRIDDGAPVLIFGNPVFGQTGKKNAVLLVFYNCKPIFEIFGKTFEQERTDKEKLTRYFIINSNGYWIKGPNPEDEFGFLFESRSEKKFLHIYPEAWEKIKSDQTGQFLVKSGLFTFTTFYPVARAEKISEQSSQKFDPTISGNIHSFDYFWKIISFVPREMCTIQSNNRLKEFLLYDSILVLFFIIVSWIIARTSVKKEYMEKLLEHLSVTDPMTGLYNRRGFFLLAQQQLRIAERINQSIVLFFFDLDDFKSVNDKFGHQEGDIALIKTAEMLRKTFRQSDILGRTGGDEFIALVIQNSPIDVESISTRLEENLKNLNSEINKEYRLSLSFGVASFDIIKKQTIDNLIAVADKMMYAQKRKKKKLRQREDPNSQQDVAH